MLKCVYICIRPCILNFLTCCEPVNLAQINKLQLMTYLTCATMFQLKINEPYLFQFTVFSSYLLCQLFQVTISLLQIYSVSCFSSLFLYFRFTLLVISVHYVFTSNFICQVFQFTINFKFTLSIV